MLYKKWYLLLLLFILTACDSSTKTNESIPNSPSPSKQTDDISVNKTSEREKLIDKAIWTLENSNAPSSEKESAVTLLGALKAENAVETLSMFISDTSETELNLKLKAVEALGNIACQQAIKKLADILELEAKVSSYYPPHFNNPRQFTQKIFETLNNVANNKEVQWALDRHVTILQRTFDTQLSLFSNDLTNDTSNTEAHIDFLQTLLNDFPQALIKKSIEETLSLYIEIFALANYHHEKWKEKQSFKNNIAIMNDELEQIDKNQSPFIPILDTITDFISQLDQQTVSSILKNVLIKEANSHSCQYSNVSATAIILEKLNSSEVIQILGEQSLQSSSKEVRYIAIHGLGESHSEKAIPFLNKIIEEAPLEEDNEDQPSSQTIKETLQALGEINTEKAADILAQYFKRLISSEGSSNYSSTKEDQIFFTLSIIQNMHSTKVTVQEAILMDIIRLYKYYYYENLDIGHPLAPYALKKIRTYLILSSPNEQSILMLDQLMQDKNESEGLRKAAAEILIRISVVRTSKEALLKVINFVDMLDIENNSTKQKILKFFRTQAQIELFKTEILTQLAKSNPSIQVFPWFIEYLAHKDPAVRIAFAKALADNRHYLLDKGEHLRSLFDADLKLDILISTLENPNTETQIQLEIIHILHHLLDVTFLAVIFDPPDATSVEKVFSALENATHHPDERIQKAAQEILEHHETWRTRIH